MSSSNAGSFKTESSDVERSWSDFELGLFSSFLELGTCTVLIDVAVVLDDDDGREKYESRGEIEGDLDFNDWVGERVGSRDEEEGCAEDLVKLVSDFVCGSNASSRCRIVFGDCDLCGRLRAGFCSGIAGDSSIVNSETSVAVVT